MNLFEHEEKENYSKPEGVTNFWNNNDIEYQSYIDRNKTLSVGEYFNKTRPYLKTATINPINKKHNKCSNMLYQSHCNSHVKS